MLNENDFTVGDKVVGIFEILKSSNNYLPNWCMVRAQTAIEDNDLSTKIIRKMMDLQIHLYCPIKGSTGFDVRARRTRIKGINKLILEHFVIINTQSNVAADWLKDNISDIPEPMPTNITLKTDKLSVGPCAFPASEHDTSELDRRYVKVRFDGVSVPFYFNHKTKTWDKGLTKQQILKQTGKTAADSIVPVLECHTSLILERAAQRLLNLSGIPEYGEMKINWFVDVDQKSKTYKFFVKEDIISEGDTIYIYNKDNKALANPAYKPVPVFMFGSKYFAAVDDKIYKVPGFYHTNTRWEYNSNKYVEDGYSTTVNSYLSEHAILSFRDLKQIPTDDQYVREKIVRAVKAKL